MKKIINKVNEAGTLLVEALAMLGLISMVTPVLYKKAAERTVELQDINASGQMRAMSSALDSFLKDNFSTIVHGGTVSSNGADLNFHDFGGNTSGVYTVNDENRDTFVQALTPYLPYGFSDGDNGIRETKLFTDEYNFAIVMEGVNVGEGENARMLNRTLTGFMVADPKNNTTEVTPIRAARIASMIGANGGYVDGPSSARTARGTQGIWSVGMTGLGLGGTQENAIVVSSLQPISSQSLDEELLHRVDKTDEKDRLNTMETDLFMGTKTEGGDINGHNIRMVNQIIMYPRENLMVNEEGQAMGADNLALGEAHGDAPDAPGGYEQNLKNALYIGNGGGANIEGVLHAMYEHFKVGENGIQYFGDVNHEDPSNPGTYITEIDEENPIFEASSSQLTYGNLAPGKYRLTIDANNNTLDYGRSLLPGAGPYGLGTTRAFSVLHADDGMLELGDVVHVRRFAAPMLGGTTGSKWAVAIGVTDRTHDGTFVQSGSRSRYTWSSNIPTEEADPATGNYELSVNGSAFVRDTLLTAKLKTFDADFATLRAGAAKEDLTNADDDDFFMKVKSIKNGTGEEATYNRTFEIGKSDDPNGGYLKVSSFAENGNGNGIVMHSAHNTSNPGHSAKGGINIVAGYSQWYDGEDSSYDFTETTDGTVKISAEKGIYLTTEPSIDNVIPVSIQGEMFKAFYDNNGENQIIEENVNLSVLRPSAIAYTRDDQNERIGQRVIQDMLMTVSASPENNGSVYNMYDVFNVNPTMSDDRFLLGESTMPYSANDTDDQPRAIEMTGSVAVYDYDRYSYPATNEQFPSFTVDKGQVAIRATQDVPSRQIEKGDRILVVDNDSSSSLGSAISDGSGSHPDQRGSVYIRKGSINLAPAQPEGKTVTRLKESDLGYNTGVTPQGYIAADRFIAHYNDADNRVGDLLEATGDHNEGASTNYEGYEVNPAYTSVMHDIKLTTRGGARLSDILPDFINKGIYVVNSTYNEGVAWNESTFSPFGVSEASEGKNVSAFLGFVPTPKCPPKYAKVVTLTPASWAMAQAGRVYASSSGRPDVAPNRDPLSIMNAEDDSIHALNFQKSTWLKSMVIPYGEDSDFKGWSAIMGFIYPSSVWDNFGSIDDGNVYWNLFPVKYKELEGYATVYCYFDRKNSVFNSNLVDHNYDQLGAGDDVNYHTKDNNEYIERLNDPALKYESPW